MQTKVKTGVFLCQCGDKIAAQVDLDLLASQVSDDNLVSHCQVLPFACLQPGLDLIAQTVAKKKLNRLVIGGCEGRLLLKKMETGLASLELLKGQIDMVNLRGHVAAVPPQDPERKAAKAAKLIHAAAAEMAALHPSTQTRARIDGPVMIVGAGIASFSAAQELARNGIDYLLAVDHIDHGDPEHILEELHKTYPGERAYHCNLKKIISAAVTSPYGTLLPGRKLTQLSGVTGAFNLSFSCPDGSSERHAVGSVIACLDAGFEPPGPGFGHEGRTAMIQSEMEDHIRCQGTPQGRVVFWVSDYDIGQAEFATLSARSAWSMAVQIKESLPATHTFILYNQQMEIPLSAEERSLNRRLDILWIPYDKAVCPTVLDRHITFCNITDHLEHEIQWDWLVMSAHRKVSGATLATARALGLVHQEGLFLTGHHARVRPEMVGREETYLAGSARWPCTLHEALSQGRRAARKTVDMIRKSQSDELFVPRVVCVVDPEKCIGCGQCQELCDCGGIGVVEGPAGGLPRIVDPMICTGGGTCAAACPYHALLLQNSTNDQREARTAALAGTLGDDECMAYACGWGGLPAADMAGKYGLTYDQRVHILGVPCIGQLDPCVMARAFKEGAPGLILIGCMPEACHHSYGVDHAWSRVNAIKKLLSLSGFDRRRIALAHADLNKPEEFVRTVDSFAQTISALGPIAKTAENQFKLKTLYNLIKNNTRVRHLLSAGLRRPGEDSYRGDQRHALEYDRDFLTAMTEEFLQERTLQLLRDHDRPFKLNELAQQLQEDEKEVNACLSEMIHNGSIHFSHSNHEALYHLVP